MPNPDQVLLMVRVEATLHRLPRRKRCPDCRQKRVLVLVEISSEALPVGAGRARCLECWGIRDHA